MLSITAYSKSYIDDCRKRMETQVAAYRLLATAAKKESGGTSASINSAVAAFEPLFFNVLVVTLECSFVHRSRTKELKNGNPLNEVRMISNSILLNRAVLTQDKTINYTPEKSILKLQSGTPIKLTEPQFTALAKAFFADLELKYT